MLIRRYLMTIALAGLFAWGAFFLVVFRMDPQNAMGFALTLFFLTFFIASSCTLGVIGFYLRMWIFRNEIFYQHISIAFRQGVLLSSIAVLCLIFQLLRALTWWSGMLLIIVALLLEFYFSSRDSALS